MLSVLVSAQYITAQAGSIAYGAATVDATALNIRSAPDTTSAILLTVDQGERLVILEKTNSEWYYVNYQGVTGYVASAYLKDVLKAENFDATGQLTGDDVALRSTPATTGDKLANLKSGTVVTVIGINNGWYKAIYSGKTGYIRSDFVTIIADSNAPAASGAAVAVSSELSGIRKNVVEYAMGFVGYDYVYGGASPSAGFDCSGLVYYVFHHYNYNVTRTASSQYSKDGTKISKSELQAGDLVFFSSNGGYSVTHVGIYIGNGQFVHASTPKIGVVVSSLDSSYYRARYYGAKNILG
jgi:cell wall-associated NlpC family hydrolase